MNNKRCSLFALAALLLPVIWQTNVVAQSPEWVVQRPIEVVESQDWVTFSDLEEDLTEIEEPVYSEPDPPIAPVQSTTSAPMDLEPPVSEVEPTGWEKPLPLSLSVEYTLVSDYIFRGINFSEHATEGRETPNHQLATSISVDLAPIWGREAGEWGSISFDTWFEWYGDQKKLNPGEDSNNQEIDYSIYYSYHVKPIETDVTIGWIHYYFPNLSGVGNDDRTNEWFFSLEHNDAWAWRWLGYQGEEGILNPTFAFYHDTHISGGVWMDVGISHGFAFESIPNLTITPSSTLNIDGGYLGPLLRVDDHDTRIAGVTYGIDVTYDLTDILQMPSWMGSMSISGFLNYFDPTSAVRGTDGNIGLEDELYGGMTVAWSW